MDGARHALVIANDEYADDGLRRLVAPAHDASALAELLGDPAIGGFDVQVVHNEPAQSIRVAVEEFFADRRPEDLLFLHFSCHGLKNAAGELFLAVHDTRPTRLASTAIAADFVNRQMADSRAQRIALFLDCCYGGAFPRGMVVRASGEAQVQDAFAGQDAIGGGRGRVIVTASSAMEYAFEGEQLTSGVPLRPSVFTSAVVDGLTTGEADADGDGWVGMTELSGYVTDRVRRATPHQTPQMWTFGAQGDLMIARSRIRRITPSPLPVELREAMTSPLAAARYGVVHDLRDRLFGDDLGHAYAAWQALHEMSDDDSRKVSDLARRFVGEGTARVAPDVLDLGSVEPGGTADGELRLAGPPVAQTAIARTQTAWIQLEQAGGLIRVRARPSEVGDLEGSVVIQGPTGECAVPVRVQSSRPDGSGSALAGPAEQAASVTGEAPPVTAPPPEPSPPAESPAPAVTPAPVESAAPAETSGAGHSWAVREPWWAVGALVVGALILVVLNWPGPVESRMAWYDASDTEWRVYRSWSDPWILASVLALAGALAARWSGSRVGIALGVVSGGAIAVGLSGLVILAAGLGDEEVRVWIAAIAVAAAMTAVVLRVARPTIRSLRPVSQIPAALVVVGGVLHLMAETVEHSDGVSFINVTPLAIVGPLVAVALAWPAISAVEDPLSRQLVVTVASTNAVLGMVGALPALTLGESAPHFLLALAGNVFVLVGIAAAVQRFASAPRPGPRPFADPGR